MSERPASRSGRISSTPSALCSAPGPFGISLVWVKGLRTVPMGSRVIGIQESSLRKRVARGLDRERNDENADREGDRRERHWCPQRSHSQDKRREEKVHSGTDESPHRRRKRERR